MISTETLGTIRLQAKDTTEFVAFMHGLETVECRSGVPTAEIVHESSGLNLFSV
jgi:hypothetical protein